MADTHSSRAFIDEQHIGIRSVVTDTVAWSTSVDRINKSLLNGMRLELNVVPVEKSMRFSRLCENLFTQALHNRNVEFRESSAELRTNALSLLDEIAEIATDCPTVSITVTGHTDNTGNESTNRVLSEARAKSVVTYLIERGVEPQRLTTNGAGSAGPIASNDDAAGRQVNRRIEFELTFP
jgi:outer membrane protein OmpA-like peptidoglycan-associated protein